jgi:hypothetical protein
MKGQRLGMLGVWLEVGVGMMPLAVGGLMPGSLGKPGRRGKGDGLLPRSSISLVAEFSSFIERKL